MKRPSGVDYLQAVWIIFLIVGLMYAGVTAVIHPAQAIVKAHIYIDGDTYVSLSQPRVLGYSPKEFTGKLYIKSNVPFIIYVRIAGTGNVSILGPSMADPSGLGWRHIEDEDDVLAINSADLKGGTSKIFVVTYTVVLDDGPRAFVEFSVKPWQGRL